MSSRMVRELAEVADELRAVPAPPLPVFPEPYSVRFADPDADAEMVSEWMNRPHLANTWHYDYPPDQWRRHLEIQFEGTYSRPYIYSMGDKPMGYMELFRVARDDLATLYYADPYDVGLHAGMADISSVEKGHGGIMFRTFVTSVFSIEPQCRRIIGDTDPSTDNYGRVFWERMGGVFLGTPHLARWGRRVAIFTWPRTPDDVPHMRPERQV